jgi:hypothetical protein
VAIFITIFHHEFRPRWPVSVSAVISSSSLLSGLPGRRLLDDNSEVVLRKLNNKINTFIFLLIALNMFQKLSRNSSK